MDRLVQRKYRLGRNTQLRSNRYAHMAASWDLQWPAEMPCLLPARIAPVDRIIPGIRIPVRPDRARPRPLGAATEHHARVERDPPVGRAKKRPRAGSYHRACEARGSPPPRRAAALDRHRHLIADPLPIRSLLAGGLRSVRGTSNTLRVTSGRRRRRRAPSRASRTPAPTRCRRCAVARRE